MATPDVRAAGLPDRAKAFLIGVGVAAVAVSVPAIAHGGVTSGWAAFAALVVGASVAQFFAFHTIRNQVFHTTPLFFVAGAMLLKPQLLVLVPLISHLPDWIRKRYAWYIQTFNILDFTLASMCAWGAARLVVDAHGDWAAAAAAAASTYVVLNNTGFAVILYLARGHNPRDILNPQILSADAALACLGVTLAHYWRADVWLIPFALAPILLLHFALRLPQLEEEARVDTKTGLANARRFREELTDELTRARRFGRPLSVIVADLDLLRNINNTYGHLAGDAVLSGVADIVRSHVRQYDVAARFGGEEFAIVLPETTEREAWETAERIREAVATTPIWAESAGEYVSVTLSMGVASFPSHGTDPDDLLHHADLAAYRAKLQGRNRAVRAGRRSRLTAVAPEPMIAAAIVEDERPREPVDAEVAEAAASRRARGFVARVGIAGVAAGAAALVLGGGAHDLYGWLVVVGIVAAGQALALEIDHGTISVGAVAMLAGAALFGVRAALPVAAVSVLVDVVARRWRLSQALLSLGARTLSLLAAAGIFSIGVGGAAGSIALGIAAGAVSFAVASWLLNVALVADGRGPWWSSWRERFGWLVPHYAVYGFVAAVTAIAYRHAGLYALAAFAVSLVAIRKTQEAVVTQARRNAQNLRHAAAMIQTQNLSLQRVNHLLKQRSTSALESLAGIVDLRDAYTAGHSRRVRDLALALGREFGLAPAELDVLGRAALFHDIGKLIVPDTILLKPSSLTEEEWTIMRRHSEEGARIIDRLGFLGDAVPAIRHHHERVDGTGYPARLAGEAIPLTARILHVADAYDSMRTNRVYQPARSESEALRELRRLSGLQFDERCVAALERALGNGTFGGAHRANGRQAAS